MINKKIIIGLLLMFIGGSSIYFLTLTVFFNVVKNFNQTQISELIYFLSSLIVICFPAGIFLFTKGSKDEQQ